MVPTTLPDMVMNVILTTLCNQYGDIQMAARKAAPKAPDAPVEETKVSDEGVISDRATVKVTCKNGKTIHSVWSLF